MTHFFLPIARGSSDVGAAPSRVIHFLDAPLARWLHEQEPDKHLFLPQQGVLLDKGVSLITECPESSGFPEPLHTEGRAPLGLDLIYAGSP